MGGQYIEELKTGGKLIVSKGGWSIQYYFPGPDQRYNGTLVTIDGNNINSYIEAWKINLNKFIDLKGEIPSGGSFDTVGEKGMHIRIGVCEGVCLDNIHMQINTEVKLQNVINDYTYAKEKADKLMIMLGSL